MANAVFLGRERELAALDDLVRRVVGRNSVAVLVTGPAGIGKTALVSNFLRSLKGFHILRASGDSAEKALDYGILSQLMTGPNLEKVPSLGYLTSSHAPAPDPLTAGAHLLEVLSALQREGPVALYVDDAQWADQPSLKALVFAFRRLVADQVLFLTTVRDTEEARLPEGLLRLIEGERGERIRLDGMSPPKIRQLAEHLGVEDLRPSVVSRLQELTRGNPLYLKALLEELPSEQLRSPGAELPAPRAFSTTIAERVSRATKSCQQLVRVCSVLGEKSLLSTVLRVAEIENPLAALEEANDAGLLAMTDSSNGAMVSFPHPLIRAAVYEGLGPLSRAQLHTKAAEVVEGVASFHHRVRAAHGPDPPLAQELVELAEREAHSGALALAADHVLAAAKLLDPGPMRDKLILEGVELLLVSGDVTRASEFVSRIAEMPSEPRSLYVWGHLAFQAGRRKEAKQLLAKSWDRHDPATEKDVGARVAALMAPICTVDGRGQEAYEWGMRALEANLLPPEIAGMARLAGLVGLGWAGKYEKAMAQLPQGDADSIPSMGLLADIAARGILRLLVDDTQGARLDLKAVADRAPRLLPVRFVALGFLAEAEFRAGNWDAALDYAGNGASLVADAEQIWLLPLFERVTAWIFAARGETAVANAKIREMLEVPEEMLDVGTLAHGCNAGAFVSALNKDPEGVLRYVQPLAELGHRDGIYEPGVLMWRELYVEALVELQRLEEAEAALIPYEEVAAGRARKSAMANACRARAALEEAKGNREAARQSFEKGICLGEPVLGPFDRGLLEQRYGSFLRRENLRREAALHLQAALKSFEHLGAKVLIEETEREFQACGLPPGRRRRRDRWILTPQEQAVARLVAAGMTNREIAENMVVSVRTVEYHLGNVYAKLGIHSRTQLMLRLA